MGKILSDKDKQYFLSLRPDDITFELLVDLFGNSINVENNNKIVKSKYKTSDEFSLKRNEYFNRLDIPKTNLGIFIFNKYIVERELTKVIDYYNVVLDMKGFSQFDSIISNALLNDIITVHEFTLFLNRIEWLSMQFHSIIAPSFTMSTFESNKKVIVERDKLLKENEEKIKNGDIMTAVEIENKLVSMAKDLLKDDPGMDLYNSGARGSFENNYKNMAIMKGPIYNPVEGKYDIVKTNFIEGISKDDIVPYGNNIISGAYPKAVGTSESGYFTKQITSTLQSVVLDEKNFDCGTKGFLNKYITEQNKKLNLYRYIIVGSKLVLLTPDNINSYINKRVKMRSSMYCISKKLCLCCAGDIFRKLGITNVGITASRMSTSLMNLSMKKFHDNTTKIVKIDKNKITI